MHITLIAGARPNFMKIAALVHAIERFNNKPTSDKVLRTAIGSPIEQSSSPVKGREGSSPVKGGECRIEYRLVHTGQHYDKNMSDTFFEELGIPAPDVNLGCGGGTQAEQTAAIMIAFEKELMAHPTDIVLVVGDVTSTMACSIVAKKMNTRVCHVEAGIRSWDLTMPEEINRMVTDSLADYMFTTSDVANANLVRMGASLQLPPEGRRDMPTPNPSLKGGEQFTPNTSHIDAFEDGYNSRPFREGLGIGSSFASVWGTHTADSTQYELLKANAQANRNNPTEAEAVLWDMLKSNNIGLHFRRQHIILDYIVDFMCVEKGLVIELDGGYHNTPKQKEYDECRTTHLQKLGYTELRFTNEELLLKPEEVVAKIKAVAESLPSLQGRTEERLISPFLQERAGKGPKVWFVGNVMIDTLLANRARFRKPEVWDALGLKEQQYIVMTMHRPANVDEENHLRALMEQIITNVEGLPIVFPIHPRTAKIFYNLWKPTSDNVLRTATGSPIELSSSPIKGRGESMQEDLKDIFPNLHIVEPMGYLEFNYLVERAKAVVTDSGGITEETTVMGVPCITLRDNTERPETCTIGTNELIGTDPAAVAPALRKLFAGEWKKGAIPPLWDGHAAERIINVLADL